MGSSGAGGVGTYSQPYSSHTRCQVVGVASAAMFLPRSVARSKRSSAAVRPTSGPVRKEDGREMNTVTVVDLRARDSSTREEEEEEEEEVCRNQ